MAVAAFSGACLRRSLRLRVVAWRGSLGVWRIKVRRGVELLAYCGGMGNGNWERRRGRGGR